MLEALLLDFVRDCFPLFMGSPQDRPSFMLSIFLSFSPLFFRSFCLSFLPSPCFPVVWQYYYSMLLLICVCLEVYVCVESLKRLKTSTWTSPTTSSQYLFILMMTCYAHWSSAHTCNTSRSSRWFRWSSVEFPPSRQAAASTQNGVELMQTWHSLCRPFNPSVCMLLMRSIFLSSFLPVFLSFLL